MFVLLVLHLRQFCACPYPQVLCTPCHQKLLVKANRAALPTTPLPEGCRGSADLCNSYFLLLNKCNAFPPGGQRFGQVLFPETPDVQSLFSAFLYLNEHPLVWAVEGLSSEEHSYSDRCLQPWAMPKQHPVIPRS